MLLLETGFRNLQTIIHLTFIPAGSGFLKIKGGASVTQATACSLRKNRPVVFLLVRAP